LANIVAGSRCVSGGVVVQLSGPSTTAYDSAVVDAPELSVATAFNR